MGVAAAAPAATDQHIAACESSHGFSPRASVLIELEPKLYSLLRFSSREPVSTSLENALTTRPGIPGRFFRIAQNTPDFPSFRKKAAKRHHTHLPQAVRRRRLIAVLIASATKPEAFISSTNARR